MKYVAFTALSYFSGWVGEWVGGWVGGWVAELVENIATSAHIESWGLGWG